MTKKPDYELAYLAAHRAVRRPKLVDEHRPWVWPLPELNGNAPVVLGSLHEAALDGDAGDRPRALLAYARADFPHRALGFLPFTRAGLLLHFLPSRTPVFAVQDGEVVAAEKLEDGTGVIVIDHGNGWMSCYRNLERMFCRARDVASTSHKEQILAGDVIGYVGGSLMEFELMRPLRFELWKRSGEQPGKFDVVDPRSRMDTWLQLPHVDTRIAPSVTSKTTLAV
jgi:murein DD-endopeptidase MepM/ murein hydrolase activator NlpD